MIQIEHVKRVSQIVSGHCLGTDRSRRYLRDAHAICSIDRTASFAVELTAIG